MLPISDFTVGNTITIAVAIYKNNLKKFLRLSFIAHLWLLVPIYGWARYFAIAAWMSRLSLNQLLERENSLEKKKYFTIRSLFLFFITALINIFIAAFLWFAVIFLFGMIASFLEAIFNSTTISNLLKSIENQEGISYLIFTWSFIFILFFISIFIHSILFVSDLCFATVRKNKLFGLIFKSHLQTKKSKFKVFKIICTSFITSFCLYFSVYTLFSLISHALNKFYLYRWDFLYEKKLGRKVYTL